MPAGTSNIGQDVFRIMRQGNLMRSNFEEGLADQANELSHFY